MTMQIFNEGVFSIATWVALACTVIVVAAIIFVIVKKEDNGDGDD